MHCKDKIPKFLNKYSQKRNIGVSVPISTFMHLWVIYIFPRLVFLFCWRKYVDRSWDYINCSQTHECGNWGWGCAIPRKGIHKWDFCCSVGNNGTQIFKKKFASGLPNQINIIEPFILFICALSLLMETLCWRWPCKSATRGSR